MVLKDLPDIVWERKCHICGGTLVKGEHFLCSRCRASLPRTYFHIVPNNPMEMRFAGLFPFERATAFLFYGRHTPTAALVQDFKYRDFPGLAREMGRLIGKELSSAGFFSDIDDVIPIPIHWSKRMRRGYNQTEYLAYGLAETAGIHVSTDLRAARAHRTQTSLTTAQRRTNTTGIFRLRHPERYAGHHILLIDDVCTTGATLTSAATTLLAHLEAAGITDAKISLLTLCATFQ